MCVIILSKSDFRWIYNEKSVKSSFRFMFLNRVYARCWFNTILLVKRYLYMKHKQTRRNRIDPFRKLNIDVIFHRHLMRSFVRITKSDVRNNDFENV